MAPSFMDRVRRFATSPEGRRVFREAKRVAKDPATRKRITDARRRLSSGRPPSKRSR
jgi:hypothetical protein